MVVTCVGSTLGEGAGTVVTVTLGECVGAGVGGIHGYGMVRVGASGTEWACKM